MRTQRDVNPLFGRQLTGEKIFHWLPAIPVAELRTVRHLLGGVTVNDLVSTATSRAVWRYMASLPPHEQQQVRAGTQWTLSDACAVAIWTKFPSTLKNRFGVCRLWAKTDEAGKNELLPPLEDLVARRAEIRTHVKTLRLGMGSFMGMKCLPNMVPICVADRIMDPPNTYTYGFSNVRLSVKMSLFGVPAKRFYAFPPQCGMSGICYGL